MSGGILSAHYVTLDNGIYIFLRFFTFINEFLFHFNGFRLRNSTLKASCVAKDKDDDGIIGNAWLF